MFAFNDITPIATLSAAADPGTEVPDRLSIVGCEDTYLAPIRHLSLTPVDNWCSPWGDVVSVGHDGRGRGAAGADR